MPATAAAPPAASPPAPQPAPAVEASQPQNPPPEQSQAAPGDHISTSAHERRDDDFFAASSAVEPVSRTGGVPPTPRATAGTSALFDGGFGIGEVFVPTGGVPADDEQITARQKQRATGWRRAVTASTFGRVTPAPSAKQLHDEEIRERIRAELADVAVIPFVNAKGGAGKTTTTVAAGNAIANHRGDRVIAVDVDPDLGNLSSRFRERGGQHTNIESLAALQDWRTYSTVRGFTVQNDDRLEMLSSQNDPRSSYRLSVEDFESTMQILRTHYNVILLDCGTAITSPLFAAIAAQATCLVVVASNDAPGLNGAWRTLTWLQSHGFGTLLSRTVLTINATSGDKPAVDMADAETRFREQVQEIVRIPFDQHLHEGGSIGFDSMSKKTRKAATELAGSIARYYPMRFPGQQGTEGY